MDVAITGTLRLIIVREATDNSQAEREVMQVDECVANVIANIVQSYDKLGKGVIDLEQLAATAYVFGTLTEEQREEVALLVSALGKPASLIADDGTQCDCDTCAKRRMMLVENAGKPD